MNFANEYTATQLWLNLLSVSISVAHLGTLLLFPDPDRIFANIDFFSHKVLGEMIYEFLLWLVI